MKTTLCILAMAPALASIGALSADDRPAIVNFTQFKEILDETEKHRASRRVPLEKFLQMSREEGTIILDTRSKEAFESKHLKGAVHLNFSDFTEGKLAKVIPSKTTRILIYCNNNVFGDLQSFAPKSGPLALNIPTFVNLYGYGYENIYELESLVDVNDPRWEFVGTSVVSRDQAIQAAR